MMCRNKTFQQLVDEITLEEVFSGTDVDAATQAALLEWLFDYPLCADDNTFLRYFRRKLNNVYPMYKDRVRISTIKGNMDPFVVDFMERLHADRSTIQGVESGTRATTGSQTDGYTTTVTDNARRDPHLTDQTHGTDTRTPNLTKTENLSKTDVSSSTNSNNTTETRDLSTDTSTGNTETRNLRYLTNGSNEEQRDLTTANEGETHSNTKNRAFNVQYPEANLGQSMGGIPSSVDNYPALIDYVSDETDTIGSADSTSEDTRTEGGEILTTTVDDRKETGTVSNSGSSTVDEDGTIRTVGSGSTNGTDTVTGNTTTKEVGTETHASNETRTQSGYETSESTSTTINTRTGDNESSETSSLDKTQTKNGRVEEVEQGRHESVVDILPRAIKAIVSTNDLKWLVDQCLTCFDTYSCLD